MNTKPLGLAVCGGGTGGHIFPALAVAETVRHLAPDQPIFYFGKANGMEKELATGRKIPFYGLELRGFSRAHTRPTGIFAWNNWQSIWKATAGFQQARSLLKELKIGAVMGTGGYVGGPVVLAAVSLGLPSLIHESNCFPGLTNRFLGRLVRRVAVSHAETAKHFPAKKTVITGYPLRERLNEPSREQGCKAFKLNPQQRVCLIFPGSLGARKINSVLVETLPQLAKRVPDLQFLWMTGEADLAMARRAGENLGSRISIHSFIHQVPEAYAAADLVLARAGAGTVAELAATGKPALLIPYPYATAHHQEHNAALLQKQGMAEVMPDRNLTGPELMEKIIKVLKRLNIMTGRATEVKKDYPAEADQEIARWMITMAGSRE